MSETEKNLRAAFAGESQANRRYLAFAQKAADEYREGVYKLFMAVAEAETIHALRHLSNLKEIKGTEDNLKAAIAGEMHEFKSMYPEMVAKAKEEKMRAAEITLSHAMEVEKVHHALFHEALENLDDFPVRDYYICPGCGHTAANEPPERCPVCGAVGKTYYKAGSVKGPGMLNL
jgi:rubrerythrin